MSKTKFTRDGWHVEGRSVCIGDTVYVPAMWCKDKTEEECKANAHLIAAAPELYEALRGAVQEACGSCAMLHVNPETYDFIEKGCPYTENNEKCDYRNCIKILRKAMGEA